MATKSKPRHIAAPIWDHGSSLEPMEHNGERLVWNLFHLIFQEISGAELLYEQVLYPKLTQRGMRPDGLVRLQFYRRQLHVEVTNSRSTWGNKGKRPRMEEIENRYRIPVLFINRQMLKRLQEDDGVEVLSDWFYRVLFKDPLEYGQIVGPVELLQRAGFDPFRRQPKSNVKAQRRLAFLERVTAPEPTLLNA